MATIRDAEVEVMLDYVTRGGAPRMTGPRLIVRPLRVLSRSSCSLALTLIHCQ